MDDQKDSYIGPINLDHCPNQNVHHVLRMELRDTLAKTVNFVLTDDFMNGSERTPFQLAADIADRGMPRVLDKLREHGLLTWDDLDQEAEAAREITGIGASRHHE